MQSTAGSVRAEVFCTLHVLPNPVCPASVAVRDTSEPYENDDPLTSTQFWVKLEPVDVSVPAVSVTASSSEKQASTSPASALVLIVAPV